MSEGKTGIAGRMRLGIPIRGCSRVSEGCRNCYGGRRWRDRFCGASGVAV